MLSKTSKRSKTSTTPTTSTTRLVERIREEYAAMPGLKLTREQACRLWGAGHERCEAALEALLSEGFLHQTGTGKYVALPRPGGSAADIGVSQLSDSVVLRCPHCGKRNALELALPVSGQPLTGTVRCEGCHRILSLHQKSA